MGSVKVKGDDIRLVAYGYAAAVGTALYSCAVCGGHFEHFSRLHYGRVVVVAVVNNGGQVHFLYEVKVVVAGSSVCAEAHSKTEGVHFLYRSKAAAQLHVAGGVVYGGNVVCLEYFKVVVGTPYAVGGQSGAVKCAKIPEPLCWGLAVFFHTVIVFGLGFGNMHMHYRAKLFALCAVCLYYMLKAGVFGVEGKVYLQPAVACVVISIVKLQCFFYPIAVLIGFIGVKRGNGTAYVCLYSGFQHSLSGIFTKVIHIRKAYCTCGQHLHNSKLTACLYVLWAKLVLSWEHMVK